MKAEFCVDEEGFDELESDLSEDLVQKFLKYIKETKVYFLVFCFFQIFYFLFIYSEIKK